MPDRRQDEPFDLLIGERASVVAADDGVPLAVRETGPSDAPLTVVFVHGFCNHMGAWHFQRLHLERIWGSRIRMVFFDHRGHGRSGAAPYDTYTIGQLGADLAAVLRAVVPVGPVVLVGHSMGAMAVLAYGGRHREEIGTRVLGVGLIATAARGVSEVGIGRSLESPLVDVLRVLARRAPAVVQGGRGAIRRAVAPLVRAASYGDRKTSRAVVRFSEQMIAETALDTLVGFSEALGEHDEAAAVAAFAAVPALVLGGDSDLITPFRNSVALADELPESELLRVPGAGHMVQLEQPEVVSEAIDRLLTRVVERAPLDRALRERATGVFRTIADRGRYGEFWSSFGGRPRRR